VIIAGGGVGIAQGVGELQRLAEHLSAPVVNSYLHNDTFPASHALAAGPLGYQGSQAAMKLLARADVVLALGTRLGPFWHPAAIRARLLAAGGEDHSGR
jgi:sulfoacetaldehyde acetyltransferase